MEQRIPKLTGIILVGALFWCSQLSWHPKAFAKPESAPKNPRVIVVLVDMSGSTDRARRTLYRAAFEKIYEDLDEGDRVVVGTITSHSFIDFKPTLDEAIPVKTIWVNRIQYERDLTKTKEKIRKEVDRLLSRKQGTPLTEILNSLNIADSIFQDEKRRKKILVVLSDMIQDSKEYKFEKDKISEDYINMVIQDRQKDNLIPKLAGVKVYVAGASASDSNKFRAVQTFWARYFSRSGADFSPYRYGHSLINFEKEL
jgi:uncharacterized protein (DUF58 family)